MKTRCVHHIKRRVSEMRKQILALGILAFVMALIMAVRATAQGKMEQYESEVILSLPWGSGPNEIGYAKDGPEDQEGLRYGPTAIDVDQDGNLYILDAVNQRVKVFDQNGELLRSFPVGRWPGSLCVGEDKAVWILHGHTIRKYALNGDLLESIKITPPDDIPLLNKMRIGGSGKIYVDEFEVQPGKVVGKGGKGENIRKSTLRRIGLRQGITESRHHYRIEETDNFSTFVATDESGRVLSKISIEKHLPSDGIVFKSEDRYGNTYLAVYRDNGMPQISYTVEVWKYDRSNNLLAKIGPLFRAFYTDFSRVGEWLVIDEDGNLYELGTESKGVKIVKWSKK